MQFFLRSIVINIITNLLTLTSMLFFFIKQNQTITREHILRRLRLDSLFFSIMVKIN